ncbi:MAG: hypothetical protein HY580_08030 [Nitrospinae bacterium]|nr:hypothetical protein [Nitrospinota bacterium]
MCKTEAGIHIYEKAILGKEYWNEDGTLNIPLHIRFNEVAPPGFEMVSPKRDEKLIKSGIYKSHVQIIRKRDQKTLGERIAFTRLGNWPLRIVGFASWLPIEDYSNVCPHPEKAPISDLVKNVFKQMNH